MGADLFAIRNLQQVSKAARFRPHDPLSQPFDFVSSSSRTATFMAMVIRIRLRSIKNLKALS
jgi:hypothetical protein